jgi:propionate catabolism operon transcriptional regulator
MNVRPHANLHAEVMACAPLLCSHSWPGNVRELRNLMQRLALFLSAEPLQALTPGFLLRHAPELSATATEDALAAPAMAERTSDTAETVPENVAEVLNRCGGNRAEAAKQLGISRTTLWRRLREEAQVSPAGRKTGIHA